MLQFSILVLVGSSSDLELGQISCFEGSLWESEVVQVTVDSTSLHFLRLRCTKGRADSLH